MIEHIFAAVGAGAVLFGLAVGAGWWLAKQFDPLLDDLMVARQQPVPPIPDDLAEWERELAEGRQ